MEKYVLMSGGTRGIGKAAAIALAQRGYTVFAGASNQRTLEDIRDLASERLVPVILDVTSPESIDAAIATARSRMGPDAHLHALVSNAGVDFNGPLQALSAEEIASMVQVNLLGAILLSRAALALMRDGASRIVFVGSAMGLWATPTVSVYASTKWGLEGLTDGLRVELGMRGIAVTMIEPGVVQTPMTAHAPAAMQRVLDRMDAEQRGIYESLMRRIVQMSSSPDAGVAAEAVAEVIARVVGARHPGSRHRVGRDAQLVGILRHLPDSWRDFIVRRTFGLTSPRDAVRIDAQTPGIASHPSADRSHR
jgi:NAD(P)-dependent dehydrogenase (short-subunit alcohol dehydrogenase family)